VNAPAPVRPYVVAGLIMGAVWAFNHGDSVAEHAIRFGFLLFVIAPLLHWLYRRRMREAQPGEQHLSFWRLIAAKATLLAVALGASALLTQWTGAGDYLVAAGIVAAFAIAGPRLHGRLLAAAPPIAASIPR
jgi:hypothetical protein